MKILSMKVTLQCNGQETVSIVQISCLMKTFQCSLIDKIPMERPSRYSRFCGTGDWEFNQDVSRSHAAVTYLKYVDVEVRGRRFPLSLAFQQSCQLRHVEREDGLFAHQILFPVTTTATITTTKSSLSGRRARSERRRHLHGQYLRVGHHDVQILEVFYSEWDGRNGVWLRVD